MSVQHKRKDEVIFLRQKCWDLRMQGFTVNRIALELNISVKTVNTYLNKEVEIFQKNHVDSIGRMKFEQLGILSHITDEAMQAWVRSKNLSRQIDPKIKTIVVDQSTGEVIQEKECGDPRYLLVALKAQENISKIIGVNAAQKLILENRTPPPIENPVTTDTPEEDSYRIYQDQLAAGKEV